SRPRTSPRRGRCPACPPPARAAPNPRRRRSVRARLSLRPAIGTTCLRSSLRVRYRVADATIVYTILGMASSSRSARSAAATPAGAGTAQPSGCTNLRLHRLGRRVARLYDEDLRALGLKGTQYSLLSYIVT